MKHTLFVMFALALAACAPETDADRWAAEEEAATGQEAQALISGGGGGGLGYSCSATLCECNPDAGGARMDTCAGMDEVCHRAGKTITCTYPPGGPNRCTCDLSVATPGRGRSVVVAPVAPALRR